MMHSGFPVDPYNVHVETKDDKQGHRSGTGMAYVHFASPEEAERARQTKHKQMMGARYIECMIFFPGKMSFCAPW